MHIPKNIIYVAGFIYPGISDYIYSPSPDKPFNNMKRYIAILLMLLAAGSVANAASPAIICSPDGSLKMTVNTNDCIYYSVSRNDVPMIDSIRISLSIAEAPVFGLKPRLRNIKKYSSDEVIRPTVPLKHSEINNDYNAIVMRFEGGYSVEFRVFDCGVAHRFITGRHDSANVISEGYNVSLASNAIAHLQLPDSFRTAYEEPYSHLPLDRWDSSARMATLPALLEMPDGTLMLFSESDVSDYPCMFLKGQGNNSFSATFPKSPVEFGSDSDRNVKILKESDYIATTDGNRSYPWRYVAIGSPADIIGQTLTCQLAQPPAIGDTSWIKPGTASWEWWNGATPYGADVDFEAGLNMDTYKYFIDFAARYNIPYIVMDEGWAMDTRNPYIPNPEVNVHEIVRYGKEKGVGVFLWLTWLTVENNFELFEKLSDWGVAGLKIDFMERSDQWMVNFYERVCKEAARCHLLVDMHGSFKPAGLEHKYPNLISYEGVRGMEQMGGCTPDNSVYLPLIRNAVGPMDYTPGAMLSMQPEYYRSERPNAAAVGTRAYQMALFVLFESGLQMIADNPTLYYKNPDCTEYITSVPVTWDETRALNVKTGEYVFVAKRKGDKWYIGGIANGNGRHRDFSIPLDFLSEGEYTITAFCDGPNAHRQAMDYRKKTMPVSNSTVLDVRLARNGGFAAVITPADSDSTHPASH